MIKYFVLVSVIFILVVFVNPIFAKQSEEFIDFLSYKIYNDCTNENLIIKEDALLDFREGIHLRTLQEKFTKWPNYNLRIIKEVLAIFNSRGKFASFAVINGKKQFIDAIIPIAKLDLSDGTKKEIKFDGRDILKCDKYVLDINGTDYYWDNQKIELPRNIYNENNFSLFGISLISNRGLTIFSFTLFGFSILGGITFILYFVKYSKKLMLFLRQKKRKSAN